MCHLLHAWSADKVYLYNSAGTNINVHNGEYFFMFKQKENCESFENMMFKIVSSNIKFQASSGMFTVFPVRFVSQAIVGLLNNRFLCCAVVFKKHHKQQQQQLHSSSIFSEIFAFVYFSEFHYWLNITLSPPIHSVLLPQVTLYFLFDEESDKGSGG